MFKDLIQDLQKKQINQMTKKCIYNFEKETCYRDYFIQFENHIYHFNDKKLDSLVKDILELYENNAKQFMLEGDKENEFLGDIAKYFLKGGEIMRVFYII